MIYNKRALKKAQKQRKKEHNTRQRKIAAIHDLSGFGRCSLTVALPIISAMGLQCCPLPTAVLSNHTGYPSFSFLDLTDQMSEFIRHWKELDLRFDGIYSGFLGSEEQISVVSAFLDAFHTKRSLFLCDPVLGDNGVLYKTCTALCDGMKKLVARADIVTPNLTELALLTGAPYRPDADDQTILSQAKALADGRPVKIAVTGIDRGEEIVNLAYDGQTGEYEFFANEKEPESYSGTGDVFASIVIAALSKKATFFEAIKKAGKFTSRAVALSIKAGIPNSDGVCFEPLLDRL